MDQNVNSSILDLGKIIDKLSIEFENKNRNASDIDPSIIQKIENGFSEINIERLDNNDKVLYHYFKANYYSIIKLMAIENYDYLRNNSKYSKSFSSLEELIITTYSNLISYYKKAIKIVEKGVELPSIYISSVYVNFANLYKQTGRILESIEVLKEAKDILKDYPMANANLAINYYSLSFRTTKESVRKFFIQKSIKHIKDAINDSADFSIDKDIVDGFVRKKNHFIKSLNENSNSWTKSNDVDDQYKKWSSNNQLALNFINILSKKGNVDNIHIPNMGIEYFGNNKKMEYYSWFNTIKQEYNIARYYIYKIHQFENVLNNHESQRYNYIVNTLDYPALGYKTEMLKSSLRIAYSILDKIGMFCCHWHNQNLKIYRIDFHKWYEKIERKIATSNSFKSLYWLSQDLDRDNGRYKDIRLLRNYLEHRYVRVLEHTKTNISEELLDTNKMEYFISIDDLENKTLETLKLVRSAIIYMISGFNLEYNKFYHNLKENHVFIPLNVTEYEDEWKN